MDISGNIIQIGDIYNNNEGTFTKQEIVIEFTVGEYANVAVLEAIQGDVEKLSAFNLGDEVKAEFYLSGRNKPWTDKSGKDRYFNVLKIRSIELINAVGAAPVAPVYQQPEQSAEQPQAQNSTAAPVSTAVLPAVPTPASVEDEDIPF